MAAECPALDGTALSTPCKVQQHPERRDRRTEGLQDEGNTAKCCLLNMTWSPAQDADNTQQATLTGHSGLPPTPKRERTCWEGCLEGVRGKGDVDMTRYSVYMTLKRKCPCL